MESLEGSEQLAHIGLVEAGAVVRHVVGLFAVFLGNAKFYSCTRVLGSELPGVFQEIFQYHSEQAPIPICRQSLCNDKLRLAFRLRLPKLSRNAPCHGAQIHCLTAHLGASHAG